MAAKGKATLARRLLKQPRRAADAIVGQVQILPKKGWLKTVQQTVFKPKYPVRVYLGFFLIILIELYLLSQLLFSADTRPENIFLAGFFALVIALTPYTFVKRIVFDMHSFSIEKYLGPSKTIEYTDVIDIGTTLIKTRNGNVGIQLMLNADELRTVFTELIQQGKISHYQLENKVVVQEIVSRKAFLPAAIISFVLWAVTSFIWPYEKSLFRDLSLLVFFVPTYIVIYQVLKSRAESK